MVELVVPYAYKVHVMGKTCHEIVAGRYRWYLDEWHARITHTLAQDCNVNLHRRHMRSLGRLSRREQIGNFFEQVIADSKKGGKRLCELQPNASGRVA